MPILDSLNVPSEPCELCGYHFGQLHRINPGCWGGQYAGENCVWLCPNHHYAIHFMMAWYYIESPGGPRFKPRTPERADMLERRLSHYHADKELRSLWLDQAKPVVRARLVAEGRYHPYVRTVPAEPLFVIPRSGAF